MNTTLSDVSALNEKIKLCHNDLDDLLQNLQQYEMNYNMSKRVIERIRELEKELGDLLERKILATA